MAQLRYLCGIAEMKHTPNPKVQSVAINFPRETQLLKVQSQTNGRSAVEKEVLNGRVPEVFQPGLIYFASKVL